MQLSIVQSQVSQSLLRNRWPEMSDGLFSSSPKDYIYQSYTSLFSRGILFRLISIHVYWILTIINCRKFRKEIHKTGQSNKKLHVKMEEYA